ncbi:MAG: glycoside hydrolase family 9 protein [Geminicoccaceae bacterium]|nr:glycoside hydrolase family 9 protein [Geminicoccaceae bacterium]
MTYALGPHRIGITIETGEFLTRAMQLEYVPDPSDWIAKNGLIRRNGRDFGQLAGKEGNRYLTFACPGVDRLDTFFNEGGAGDPAAYRILDESGRQPTPPFRIREIWRKTRIVDTARLGRFEFAFILEHRIVLELDESFEVPATFNVAMRSGGDDILVPHSISGAAIHAPHTGFAPDDPLKAAYYSLWRGSDAGGRMDRGTELSADARFRVVDTDSGVTVFEGRAERRTSAGEPPALDAAPVYRLDFSGLARPGNYRVCISLTCSFPFTISDEVWLSTFRTAMQGFLNQRSGMELGPPWTQWRRPRSLHPDDGFRAYRSKATLMDTSMGLNLRKQNSFKALTAQATGETVAGAWGGWHDAGDWDRRIHQLGVALDLMMILELRDGLASLDLNIPESANDIPDILDEALWSIDLYARLQDADGGVSGGIESAGHPQFGESSWTESQNLYVYAADPWSSWTFAAAAARAARLLAPFDPSRARTLADRAAAAFNWAEAHKGDLERRNRAIGKARNLAALELYRLSGDEHFHDVFLKTTSYRTSARQNWKERQIDAGFSYAMWVGDGDPQTRRNAADAIIDRADSLLAAPAGGFGQTVDPHRPYGYSYTSTVPADAADVFVQAHALTGDTRYLQAIIGETLFGLGANPLDMTYMTGLGPNPPRAPLIVDMLALEDKTPPAGITLFGHYDWTRRDHRAIEVASRLMSPPYPKAWPIHEMYIGFPSFVPVSEYSMHATIGPTALVLGYLAGRPTTR